MSPTGDPLPSADFTVLRFIQPSAMQALCPFLLGKSRRVLLWWVLCCVPAWCWAQSEPAAAVHGHVLQSASQRPLSEVLVMAWPCGLASTTDTWGAFRVACPHGVGLADVGVRGPPHRHRQVEGRAHVDVWLEPLGFTLSQRRCRQCGLWSQKANPLTRLTSCAPWTTPRVCKASTLGPA